jgi:acyl carrier protein
MNKPGEDDVFSQLEHLLGIGAGTLNEDEEVRGLKNWDSLKLLEIIAFADEELHIEIDADHLAKCVTVGDILKLLKDAAAAKGKLF